MKRKILYNFSDYSKVDLESNEEKFVERLKS
jgi:hypothetical protein